MARDEKALYVDGALYGATMNAVGKAIWFIETHFSSDVSLDEIAKSVGVSRYYLVRAFGAATGCSVMRYVRGRRLTEAARSLINGAPDILTVAPGRLLLPTNLNL
jgi:AraC family transcriptional regulator